MSGLVSAWGAGVDMAALRFMTRLWLSGGDPVTEGVVARSADSFDRYTGEELLADPLQFYGTPGIPHVEVRRHGRLRGGRIERYCWPSRYRTWDPPRFGGFYNRKPRGTRGTPTGRTA